MPLAVHSQKKPLQDIQAPSGIEYDPLIVRGFEAVRNLLRESGINPTPKSRIAFSDDDTRHTSGCLGGTIANDAKISRVALVQVWEIDGKYEMQLHMYDPDHASVAPLKSIAQLAESVLREDQRCPMTDSVASGLTAKQFARFLGQIEALEASA